MLLLIVMPFGTSLYFAAKVESIRLGIPTFLDIDPLHWNSLSYLSLVNLHLNSKKSS